MEKAKAYGCDRLTPEAVLNKLHTKALGRRINFYETVTSTNDQAKLLARVGVPHGSLVLAEHQTQGRGRYQRVWASPSGEGIWMSLILRPKISPANASKLTLLAAMAICDGIQSLGLSCEIKWPNDLVIHGKKVCGILTEMNTLAEQIQYVIVGMGINVHNTCFPGDIRGVATSVALELEAQQKADDILRSALIARVMDIFEKYYERFLETENLDFIREAYNRRLVNLGKTVCILEGDTRRTGRCRGIDWEGCLVVDTQRGEEHLRSGEVSVRGVLGYV